MGTIELLEPHFPHLSSRQKEQLGELGELYRTWNDKINVVSRKDIDELYERHILHSLAIAKFITFEEGTKVMDVGTGGGFPGIPLAILFPSVQFHLVDSIRKKISVVQGVSQSIGLANLEAEWNRAEKVNDKFDFIVCRAVTRMKKFHQLVHNKILEKGFNTIGNGIIALKGGDLNDEMKELGRPYQSISIKKYFNAPFFETKNLIYVPY